MSSDAMDDWQVAWFLEVYATVQRGQRVLTLGPNFPAPLNSFTSEMWWLRYFRVAPLTDQQAKPNYAIWEPTAEGIRLATRLRLQGRL